MLESITNLQLRTGKQPASSGQHGRGIGNKPRLSFKDRLLKKLLKTPLDMLRRKE